MIPNLNDKTESAKEIVEDVMERCKALRLPCVIMLGVPTDELAVCAYGGEPTQSNIDNFKESFKKLTTEVLAEIGGRTGSN